MLLDIFRLCFILFLTFIPSVLSFIMFKIIGLYLLTKIFYETRMSTTPDRQVLRARVDTDPNHISQASLLSTKIPLLDPLYQIHVSFVHLIPSLISTIWRTVNNMKIYFMQLFLIVNRRVSDQRE